MLEQSDGRIQCYFSEARSWISSANSGTSMVESLDGGNTWIPDLSSRPYRVMRKKYWNPTWERFQYTDQMPVGVVLDDNGKMAFAMEDVDMGNYSLGIVYSPDDGNWKKLQGADVGPSERIDSLSVNATGPYMVKFPTGEVLGTFTRNKATLQHRHSDRKERPSIGEAGPVPASILRTRSCWSRRTGEVNSILQDSHW